MERQHNIAKGNQSKRSGLLTGLSRKLTDLLYDYDVTQITNGKVKDKGSIQYLLKLINEKGISPHIGMAVLLANGKALDFGTLSLSKNEFLNLYGFVQSLNSVVSDEYLEFILKKNLSFDELLMLFNMENDLSRKHILYENISKKALANVKAVNDKLVGKEELITFFNRLAKVIEIMPENYKDGHVIMNMLLGLQTKFTKANSEELDTEDSYDFWNSLNKSTKDKLVDSFLTSAEIDDSNYYIYCNLVKNVLVDQSFDRNTKNKALDRLIVFHNCNIDNFTYVYQLYKILPDDHTEKNYYFYKFTDIHYIKYPDNAITTLGELCHMSEKGPIFKEEHQYNNFYQKLFVHIASEVENSFKGEGFKFPTTYNNIQLAFLCKIYFDKFEERNKAEKCTLTKQIDIVNSFVSKIKISENLDNLLFLLENFISDKFVAPYILNLLLDLKIVHNAKSLEIIYNAIFVSGYKYLNNNDFISRYSKLLKSL